MWKKELQIHRSNIKSATTTIGYGNVSVYDLMDSEIILSDKNVFNILYEALA